MSEPKKKRGLFWKVMVILLIVFFITSFFVDSGFDASMAYICAQQEVEKHLMSPASADFPLGIEGNPIGENMYLVSSYVDSQNAFGAMIRTEFICNVEIIDPENFLCEATCNLEES